MSGGDRHHLDAHNGFITPTLKVKRARIEEAYGAQYEVWTARHQSVVWADA